MPGFVLRHRWRRSDAIGTRVRIAVALTDDAVGRIHQVAAACRALGFAHDSTLGGIGVLTGSAEFGDLPKLRTVPGVLAVEIERGRPPRWPSRYAWRIRQRHRRGA
jgi:hypothetical protein